ncbi:CHAP domain-containing protein [Pantoea allii]|uniref:CHAP domain-containing protein n=1 Tax=Pantoea allii TaxID=574096 RepID=UPI0024B7BF61|nr:CHAP domain-containing protein [Pantoea allii]MDJ0087731.1 CHAP domain-containing protein [Pantoea allii]
MWDAHRAAVYARQHAVSRSLGKCAHYVTSAVQHGGANLARTPYAKDMGRNLVLAGFHQVHGTPIEGDVAIIQPIHGHPYGHACIYDGHQWISDFVQRTMYPGPSYRTEHPSFVIYRHN